jgi:hypothetical protein
LKKFYNKKNQILKNDVKNSDEGNEGSRDEMDNDDK